MVKSPEFLELEVFFIALGSDRQSQPAMHSHNASTVDETDDPGPVPLIYHA